MVTKSQQLMIDDGLPATAVISPQERIAAWAANPSKQYRWNTTTKESKMRPDDDQDKIMDNVDISTSKTTKEVVAAKKPKKTIEQPAEKIPEKLAEKPPEKPPKKDAKKAAKKPIKPIKGKQKEAKAKEPQQPQQPQQSKQPKQSQHPITAALGLRSNSLMEKIALYLGTEGRMGKMVGEKLIIKHLYGDERSSNRIEVLMKEMKKDKFELRKDVKNGVTSYGLYAKK